MMLFSPLTLKGLLISANRPVYKTDTCTSISLSDKETWVSTNSGIYTSICSLDASKMIPGRRCNSGAIRKEASGKKEKDFNRFLGGQGEDCK